MANKEFDKFYKEHYGLVTSIARKFVNSNDLEDAVHEIFIRVWRYFDTIEDERKRFFWLYSVARNGSINYAKSQSIRPLSKGEELPEELEADFHLEDWWEDVNKALAKIDPMVRDVTLLKLQGYNQREVSEELGLGRKQFYDLWSQGKEYLVEHLVRGD